jgi:tetratricopeptide (TPR) repeat protein
MYRRALAIFEASYGPDHPNVANCLNNLARFLQDANRLSEAEPLFRRALAILARFTWATGSQHPKFEMVRTNYLRVLGDLGRPKAEIESALKSALDDGRQPPP